VTGGSLWLATAGERPATTPLETVERADVVVLGGGITGITTALLLQEAGADVVVLEAARVGDGVTGHTTAKVTSQHGLIYDRLTTSFGADTARRYGAAQEAALDWIEHRVAQDGIDCDLRRQDAYAFAMNAEERAAVERECDAARAAGLPAGIVGETPLPFPVAAALRFTGQAEFHPLRYLMAVAGRFLAAGGRIHERSRAVQVDQGGPVVVKTPGGRVGADHVVVATHYPFPDRSLAWARVTQHRSYVIACRIAGAPPAGMHISAGSPSRSVRAAPDGAGGELVLIGGEGHRTGAPVDTEARYAALERFARAHWDVEEIPYRWSSQDATTAGGLPYVGRFQPFGERALMATGFAKWGMTGGTAAALLLADQVLGREHTSAAVFDPLRPRRQALPTMLREGAANVGRLVGDSLRTPARDGVEALAPGEGAIVRHGGERVAAHRRDDGSLVAVSTRCSHQGCQVAWNPAERSWDCPCHGSRFSPEGEVLHGPAVHRLERKPLA
jgi:glycine/D-amino acid oxidase-like deaminating enzyme/nitrite reductase/ring-hydroxylating ferredoxin subunit